MGSLTTNAEGRVTGSIHWFIRTFDDVVLKAFALV